MSQKRQMTISAFCGTHDTPFVLRAGARLVYATDGTWTAWERVAADDRWIYPIGRKRIKSCVAARVLFGEHKGEMAGPQKGWIHETALDGGNVHHYERLAGMRFKFYRINRLDCHGARYTNPFTLPDFGPCVGFELPGGIQGILMACIVGTERQ